MWTTIDKFPKGFRDCQIALRPKIFEASHTYRIKGSEQYLTIIEENGRRYYKAYLADRLDGPWKPIADTAEKPFAGWMFCVGNAASSSDISETLIAFPTPIQGMAQNRPHSIWIISTRIESAVSDSVLEGGDVVKVVLTSWFSLLVMWSVGVAHGESDTIRLRVLSYNIHHGEGVDRKLDLDRIARVMEDVKPDIVALQEVDQGVSRSKREDQPAELARLTDMKVVFGDNISVGGGKYGNAILSRFPIVEHRNHRLPNVDNGEQRGVLQATIRIPDCPQPLILLATHLDHRPNDRERFESAQAINALAARLGNPLALLAGDLNDTIDSRTLNEFEKHWTRTNDKPLPTVPVGKPDRQIDFVLFRPADRWKVVEMTVLPEAIASDPRAVLAIIELLHITNE